MNYDERINEIVQYAIDSNYEAHHRQNELRNRLSSAKNICIFGVGEFFWDCADQEHFSSDFQYVSDNNPERWGKTFKGRKCLSPQQLLEIEDLVVIIMVGDYKNILQQLHNLGLEAYPFDYYCTNVYDPHYDKQWFLNNRSLMLKALDCFEDDASREVYVEAIANRIAPPLAEKTFNDIKIPGEYYHTGLFEFTEDEYMVDAGAYIGDSAENFVKAVDGMFGGIYAFELDAFNFMKLEETKKRLSSDKLELFCAGVSDENKEIFYEGIGVGANISDTAMNKAKVVRMDDALAGKKVTFIKMDVEGAELTALEGAREIIQTQKPKLAISAYHYLSDLWKVPLWIKAMDTNYKVYMRHHAPVVWDTDCYAYVN